MKESKSFTALHKDSWKLSANKQDGTFWDIKVFQKFTGAVDTQLHIYNKTQNCGLKT